jgi:2'-5' RNA ligase
VTEPQAPRRIFFAIWPDAAALEALDAAAHAGAAACGGRPMRRDSLHMTLVFVGAATPEQLLVMQEAAARVRAAPFEMVLDRMGWWAHNHILWAGCHAVPSGQRRLLRALAEQLDLTGFRPEARAHVPHVTLARHVRCERVPVLDAPIRWQVGEFSLVESLLQPSGARYRTLSRWPLRENA